jgi:hypothetical protein
VLSGQTPVLDPAEAGALLVYLRPLGTLPNVSIHYGHFLTHEITMPRVPVPGRRQEYVQVIKTEEKGSDVNLATHLLHDAHMGGSKSPSSCRTIPIS